MMEKQPIPRRAYRQRYVPSFVGLLCAAASILFVVNGASAQYADWKHSGSIYILTTPGGANLPASASVKDFPLLVRLHRDHFPFAEAEERGRDIRFSAAGKPLSYEIEQWDRDGGTASVWVRIPLIRGNEHQEIKIHWGNADAKDASNGKVVFNAGNGYVGVWHLGDTVHEVTGNLKSEDRGTTKAAGMIGGARHFSGGKVSVFCGNDIQVLPEGASPHSTQAWFRPELINNRYPTIVAWGWESKPKKRKKVKKIPKKGSQMVMKYSRPGDIKVYAGNSSGDALAKIPDSAKGGWVHVVHTYENNQATLYINGTKHTMKKGGRPLSIPRPTNMWIGGWWDDGYYGLIGDIDEVRISGVARSAGWVRLEYENQKPMQTLVGSLVQKGTEFSISPTSLKMKEGETVKIAARAGGAQKISWSMVQGDKESVIARDRFNINFDAGRVTGDQTYKIRVDAIYADRVRSIEVPVTVKESVPDPKFALIAPANWDGRQTIEIEPKIKNPEAMQSAGAGQLDYRWEVFGLATIKDEKPGKLVLSRAQNSGTMTVALTLSNGGAPITVSTDVAVQEPTTDAWVHRVPDKHEMPAEGQFYARDDSGQGTMHCRGTLKQKAEKIFLRVFVDDKKYAEESKAPGKDGTYSFAIKLKPGLVKYRMELGIRTGDKETVLHSAGDIVCGDAYLISGQSNAEATAAAIKKGTKGPPAIASEWVRSYGGSVKETDINLWCKPVWKFTGGGSKEDRYRLIKKHKATLGWWGMELAKGLVEKHKVPIFIVNGAKGGTKIIQHQRNDNDPTDPETIYGRMLWRVRKAKLTHGIRAVIWHQGENDQDTNLDGSYGWQKYQRYFIEMSADWKRDFPNVRRYYIFQIWPRSCGMGGEGRGDMLREKQRTLPYLYSNMNILSTLGIRPPGTCHYPIEGYNQFVRMLQPLIERDFYGGKVTGPLTAANLKRAYYKSASKDAIALEFDQPVVWQDTLVNEFRLDGVKGKVVSGSVSGNVLTLKLKESVQAAKISYIDESRGKWSQDRLLVGKNGIAALTFCNVLISDERKRK